MKLTRLLKEPILEPVPRHDWEKGAVFNCAAVKDDKGLVHLVYRGVNTTVFDEMVSSLGHAVSSDGIHFERQEDPVYTREADFEKAGCEDPRITRIGDDYYMVYVGFSGKYEPYKYFDTKVCMASTRDFASWKRYGVILDERENKDAGLFPEKINGRYLLLHRRAPDIWIADSEDFYHWQNHTAIMSPQGDGWESVKIGIGGPPHRTERGWLLFYHAVDKKSVYRLGVALLDLRDPRKVIWRQQKPILEPELDWELKGFVPNVVFSCGSVKMGDRYYVYYGGADQVIGVAAVPEKDVEKFIRTGK